MDERNYWLGFSVFPGIGPKTLQLLLEQFGSAKAAFTASRNDLLNSELNEVLATNFDQFRNDFSPSDYARKLRENKVEFFTQQDEEYPDLLKAIKNPPIVLYVRGSFARGPVKSSFPASTPSKSHKSSDEVRAVGSLPAFATPLNIAIVGTRKITQYGKEVTEMFARDLVAAGFTIVSGLAMGIDAVAHQTAIENNGKTIAVLGCGVDCCTPRENQYIYNSIVAGNGCVVSEFPLGQPPMKGSFPSRNRIIAGLSLGVLVTEGAEDSGALITADYAFKNNRKVFAVPGPITSNLSKGPYQLIQKGAKLVTKAQDILAEFKVQNATLKTTAQNSKLRDVTDEERKILDILENEQMHFDEIVRKTGSTSKKIGSILSMLEIKGKVRSSDGIFTLVLE